MVRLRVAAVLRRVVCCTQDGETALSLRISRLTLALYPLGAGAMSVNCFFLSLIGHQFGLPVLSTFQSIIAGSIVALPLTWLFAPHIQSLMRDADGD